MIENELIELKKYFEKFLEILLELLKIKHVQNMTNFTQQLYKLAYIIEFRILSRLENM